MSAIAALATMQRALRVGAPYPHVHMCPICCNLGPVCNQRCTLDDFIVWDDLPDTVIHAHPIPCSSLCRLCQYVRDRKFERQRRAQHVFRRLGHAHPGSPEYAL